MQTADQRETQLKQVDAQDPWVGKVMRQSQKKQNDPEYMEWRKKWDEENPGAPSDDEVNYPLMWEQKKMPDPNGDGFEFIPSEFYKSYFDREFVKPISRYSTKTKDNQFDNWELRVVAQAARGAYQATIGKVQAEMGARIKNLADRDRQIDDPEYPVRGYDELITEELQGNWAPFKGKITDPDLTIGAALETLVAEGAKFVLPMLVGNKMYPAKSAVALSKKMTSGKVAEGAKEIVKFGQSFPAINMTQGKSAFKNLIKRITDGVALRAEMGTQPGMITGEMGYALNPESMQTLVKDTGEWLEEEWGMTGPLVDFLKSADDTPGTKAIAGAVEGMIVYEGLRVIAKSGQKLAGFALRGAKKFVADSMRELDAVRSALPASMFGADAVPPKVDIKDAHTLEFDGAQRQIESVGQLNNAERAVLESHGHKTVDADKKVVYDQKVVDAVNDYKGKHGKGWRKPVLEKAEYNDKGNVVLTWKKQHYGFARDAKGELLKGPDRKLRLDKITKGIVSDVKNIKKRAAAGDKNAITILRQARWYKAMVSRLRDEYGGMGDLYADLLGGASPNTPVKTNWNFAAQALHRFSKGEFRDEVKQFVDYLNQGGSPGNYTGPLITQENGKLFGMNSRNLMLAMADLWRVIEPGKFPKARNFSGNLIGSSGRPTVDVWAARWMDRLSGQPRVSSKSEMGIPGSWNAKATKVGGDYGFGEEAITAAGKELGIDPDDLQAIGWFSEKELWGRNKWTSKLGEGGSFEQMADLNPTQRTTLGFAAGQPGVAPTAETVARITKDFDATLGTDPKVRAFKVKETTGQFMNENEHAFDVEVSAEPDWDAGPLMEKVAKHAEAEGQDAAFVSKNITDMKDSANARPGAELYFKQRISVADAEPILEELRKLDVDGFTFSVDIRDVGGEKNVVGIRYQYVPEFDVMYGGAKVEDLPKIMKEKRKVLGKITSKLNKSDNVSHATITYHDTVVITKNNYGDFTNGSKKRPSGVDSRSRSGFGRGLSDNVESAVGTTGEPTISGGSVPVKPDGNAKTGTVKPAPSDKGAQS